MLSTAEMRSRDRRSRRPQLDGWCWQGGLEFGACALQHMRDTMWHDVRSLGDIYEVNQSEATRKCKVKHEYPIRDLENVP